MFLEGEPGPSSNCVHSKHCSYLDCVYLGQVKKDA